jgi:hypothetical protein
LGEGPEKNSTLYVRNLNEKIKLHGKHFFWRQLLTNLGPRRNEDHSVPRVLCLRGDRRNRDEGEQQNAGVGFRHLPRAGDGGPEFVGAQGVLDIR